jgi:hypothetical protein
MKKLASSVIVIVFLLITITSVENWSIITLAPTLTFYLIRTLLFTLPFIWAFIVIKNPFNELKIGPVSLFLILIVITGIRSVFIPSNLDQWTSVLTFFPAMLSFISVYYLDYPYLFKNINYYWFRIAPLLCLIWIPFMSSTGEAMGYFLPLLLLHLLFINIIPKKSKWILIAITFIIILVCYKEIARSHVLKFGIALLFGISLYFKSAWFYIKAIKLGRIVFLLTPILLLILGITNIFNVFRMDEYISGDFSFQQSNSYGGNQREALLLDDTRTFLYEESILSAIKNKYVLFGRSFARGYDSNWQARRSERAGKIVTTNVVDRISEVAIINIFTWMGLFGVCIYFWIFIKASSLAIYHSNNSYIKIVGLYLTFRWMYGWVEDFQGLNISTLTLWMMLSICFSKSLRNLNNYQISKFMRSIFIK